MAAVAVSGQPLKRQRRTGPGGAGAEGATGSGDSSWETQYHALKVFVAAQGHARVPLQFPGDPGLGTWVSTQRRAYAAELERKAGKQPKCMNRISTDRIKKLQAIGFQWTVVARHARAEWEERFVALTRFVDKHGHARVPLKFADDAALGTWVSTQRRAHAAELERKAGQQPKCQNRINADQIKKLQDIGFEWTIVSRRS